MNLIKKIKSKNFQNKDQFQKREIIGKHILTNDFCKIGSSVLCFELESIVDKKSIFFYTKDKVRKTNNLTIGIFYQILDHKEGKIKIKNDKGQKLWYSIYRFIRSLAFERKEKILKINENVFEIKK